HHVRYVGVLQRSPVLLDKLVECIGGTRDGKRGELNREPAVRRAQEDGRQLRGATAFLEVPELGSSAAAETKRGRPVVVERVGQPARLHVARGAPDLDVSRFPREPQL